MNKQVKININDKAYYCDIEVLKLIERLQDKVELLEYNRDKAIELIEQELKNKDIYIGLKAILEILLNILRGEDNE